MKKNRMMRLASVLLVMVLLSTSVISGTFAKYTTTDSAKDSARVAAWGIKVEVGGNLFGQYYDANGAANSDQIVASAATSVDSSNGDDVVAPGTKNEDGFTVSITGTPEVSYQVTATNKTPAKDIWLGTGDWGTMVEVKGLNAASSIMGLYTLSGTTYTKVTADEKYVSGTYYELHDYVNVATEYHPLVWTVTKSGSAVDISATTLDGIAAEMATKLSVSGDANDSANAGYKLAWEWPFSKNATNDKMDTILGNLQAGTAVYSSDSGATYGSAASGTNYNLTAGIDFEVTVEQTN